MIINIRGTSGSGKTTAVRKLMALGIVEPLMRQAAHNVTRQRSGLIPLRPGAYKLLIPGLNRQILVLGSYEGPTGGADTIGSVQTVFREVQEYADRTYHVLFEGLLISRSKGRMVDLWNKYGDRGLLSLHLLTPLEVCLSSVQARRDARGDIRPFNRMQTEASFDRVLKISNDLSKAGYPIQFVTREDVVDKVLEALFTAQGLENAPAHSPSSA